MDAERWRQVESLYHAAIECGPAGRSRLLATIDADVRREVESLLAQDGSMLDRPAWADRPDARTLEAGAVLGRYEIEALLGAGGMGEVFRARDTRLGRRVAIKTSHARFSDRFEREARAISALNHPHICTLHDVGPDYLVMELVEGETLAARLKQGALLMDETLAYGAQIAEALAEAHAHEIVHRDLKPANIMLTRHGVKVLDFGLAKMLSDGDATQSREVMGTLAYMAPEQVEMREPTAVTDLFSLGLILYEMATGKPPFPGASLGRMLASGSQVSTPPLSRHRKGVLRSFDGLVSALLAADPGKRPQSAAAVARELSAMLAHGGGISTSMRKMLTVAGIIVLLLAVGAVTQLARRADRRNASELSAIHPLSYEQLTSFTDSAAGPALSPDGRMLAFFRGDRSFMTPDQIWVKLLPNGEPVQLTHDAREKYNLAFSPDGTRIAYTVFDRTFDTEIISALGGEPQPFMPNAAGLSWLDDQHLLFSRIKTGIHMGVVTSRTDGSDLHEIYFPVQDRGMAHYSYASPDRKWVLMTEMDPEWHPCRIGPFDAGAATRLVGPPGACMSAAWSPDGKWMYFAARVSGRQHLWRQRFPDGQPEQITFGSTEEDGIALAADGGSLITSIATQQNAVWIHDSHGDRALSAEGYADETRPVFSPDGKRLYYLLRRDSPESPAELCRADVDKGTSAVVLPGISMRQFDISSDEHEVVFSTETPGAPSQLWIAALDRGTPPHRIAANGEAEPHFGSDDTILFRFSEGDAYYFGVMKRDGGKRRKVLPDRVLSVNAVSPDRRFIVVSLGTPDSRDGDGRMLLVPIDGGAARQICTTYCVINWSPNGKYFSMEISQASREYPGGKSALVPVPAGETLPEMPAGGPRRLEDWLKLPGAKMVQAADIAPGADPGTWAYVKRTVHANLFRIQLH